MLLDKVYALRNEIFKAGKQLIFKVHIEKMLNSPKDI